MAITTHLDGVKKFVGTDFLKTVSVTVNQGASSGVSAADRALINGLILGIYPNSNQDQFVDSVALAATTGVLTVTLAAGATATNGYSVTVLKGKNA
jgi:hypothetical protein